jgi:hypothetical protein
MPSNAHGKVPQSIGCFLKVPKIKQKLSLLKMFDIRRSQKDSKGTTKEQNVPKGTKLSQGSFKISTKSEPTSKKIIPNHVFFFH